MNTNTPIRELLANRKAAIKAQLIALKQELAHIQAAEDAIAGKSESSGETTKRTTGGTTIMDMIIDVLARNPQGLEAVEIIRIVKDVYGKEIPRSSMSPQLSRLKAQGEVVLEGKVWKVAAKKAKASGDTEADAGTTVDEGFDLV